MSIIINLKFKRHFLRLTFFLFRARAPFGYLRDDGIAPVVTALRPKQHSPRACTYSARLPEAASSFRITTLWQPCLGQQNRLDCGFLMEPGDRRLPPHLETSEQLRSTSDSSGRSAAGKDHVKGVSSLEGGP